jgi:hypothetical protein
MTVRQWISDVFSPVCGTCGHNREKHGILGCLRCACEKYVPVGKSTDPMQWG